MPVSVSEPQYGPEVGWYKPTRGQRTANGRRTETNGRRTETNHFLRKVIAPGREGRGTVIGLTAWRPLTSRGRRILELLFNGAITLEDLTLFVRIS